MTSDTPAVRLAVANGNGLSRSGDPVEAPGHPTAGGGSKAPAVETLLWSAKDLARALGISPATLYRLASAGKIGPQAIRLAGSVRYSARECRRWVESRMADGRLPDRREWLTLEAQRNGRG